MPKKNSTDTIGIRARHLPVCRAVQTYDYVITSNTYIFTKPTDYRVLWKHIYCFQGIQAVGIEAHNHNNLPCILTFEPLLLMQHIKTVPTLQKRDGSPFKRINWLTL